MPSKAKTKTKGTGAGGTDDEGGRIAIFNEKDLRFIRAVMENMNERPDVDWSKVAEAYSGTKDDKQAKEKYRVLAIKLGWVDQAKTPATRHAKPTEADMRFMKAIFGNMTGKPNTNWEQVARDYGDTKDVKQAKEKYRVTALKYGWVRKTPTKTSAKLAPGPAVAAKVTRSKDTVTVGGGGGGGATGSDLVVTGTKRPREYDNYDDDDDDDDQLAPAKRSYRRPVPSARPVKPATRPSGGAVFPNLLPRVEMVDCGIQTTPSIRDFGTQTYADLYDSDDEI